MAMIGATTNSTQRDGKYTQGFVFEHGQAGGGYARAIVERSCAAVVTLLQDVFAVAEKTAFQQASTQTTVPDQNRAFTRLADIIRHRSLLERTMTTAVACAYANLASKDNLPLVEQRIFELEKLRCERLDILSLFHVEEVVNHTTNCNRPLLLDFSAQLSVLFETQARQIGCNPLSPATLIGGYVAGLMCVDMDILTKQILFRTFEQEFLSKLSVLMNSIVLRLEQENFLVKRAVSFDDKDAGPIARVVENPSLLPLALLQESIDSMHKSLSAHKQHPLALNFYELSGEDSLESTMHLISNVKYHYASMQTTVMRSVLNVQETEALIDTRILIADRLNATFADKRIPAALNTFLRILWPDVLFDILVVYGEESEVWQDAVRLQRDLLESVTPETDSEKVLARNRLIPDMIRNLRRLLDESGCTIEEITEFLGELKSLHLQNMQQKLSAETFVPWVELSLGHLSPGCEKILDENGQTCYTQMRDMVSLLTCR